MQELPAWPGGGRHFIYSASNPTGTRRLRTVGSYVLEAFRDNDDFLAYAGMTWWSCDGYAGMSR